MSPEQESRAGREQRERRAARGRVRLRPLTYPRRMSVEEPLAVPRAAPTAAPPSMEGVSWRALRAEDLPMLDELVTRCEAHDDPPYRTSRAELAEDLFSGPGRDPARDTIGALDSSGRLLAYGRVACPAGGSGEVQLGAGVDPAARGRGLGHEILQWQIARARALLAQLGARTGVVTTYVEDSAAGQASLLQGAGFAPRRYVTELRRDLTLEIPSHPLAGSLSLERWRPELDDQVRAAHNETWAAQPGFVPLGVQEWYTASPVFAPEWSYIVVDRSTDRSPIAGYLLSGRYEEDWAAFGFTLGTTDLLGVRGPWRGQGIATAMLLAAMRAYAADGIAFAGISVETDEPTRGLALFGRLGYVQTHSSAQWALPV